MALALNPTLLIADEPTTALDVTVQAQVMDLLKELQQDFGMALILITHDLGVAASVADRVMIMYAGTAVEKAAAPAFYREPRHPYARGLMDSVPRLHDPDTRLHDIQGQPPSLIDLPSGCAFHPRCPYVVDQCSRERPVLEDIGEGRQAACFRVNEIREGS